MSSLSVNQSSEKSKVSQIATQILTYAVLVPLARTADKLGIIKPLMGRVAKSQGFQETLLNYFKGYEANEHDIFVCAYPKSGTNWMMQVAYQIANLGDGNYDYIHDVIPWPDAVKEGMAIPLSDIGAINASPTKLRIIKTHLEWDYVPYSPSAKYIWVYRDPKDAFVSGYFFFRDIAIGPMMPSVKTWLDLYLSDSSPLGSWARNFASYWRKRQLDNVLAVNFKDMKKDPEGLIRQIADFMDVTLTEEQFQEVLYKSSFAYMKTINHKFTLKNVTPWTQGNVQMIRSGKHGNSAELITSEQQVQIDDYCRTRLQELAPDFSYDEAFALK